MKRTDQKIGYVYKHIRNDTQEVFYVGVGGFCKREKPGTYMRAYSKADRVRNKWWNNIINITEYTIEIYKENLTQIEAFVIERELIKLYGRRDKNDGTLVNLTDGGEGHYGWNTKTKRVAWNKGISKFGKENNFYGKKHTDESKEKNRQSHLGKKLSQDHKDKISNGCKGKGGNYVRTEEIKQKIKNSLKEYYDRIKQEKN